MSPIEIGWGASLLMTMWFVPVAAIRVMAYRAGTDATPGMRGVAITGVTLAGISVLALILLTALLVT
jgi:hypothetical protein